MEQEYRGITYMKFYSFTNTIFSSGKKDFFEENFKPCIITWLNNEALEETDIYEDEDISNLLLDIIYKFVDNDYLKK